MGVSLSNARYEEIKQIIVDMIVKYNICCVPINGFELANFHFMPTTMLEG